MAVYDKQAPRTAGHAFPGRFGVPPSDGPDRLKLELRRLAGQPTEEEISHFEENNWRSVYDVESTVVLISSYPRPRKTSAEDSKGVSSYAQNLVPHLSELLAGTGQRLIILTEKSETDEAAYAEKRVLVIRSWRRNAIGCFWQILRTLRSRLSKPKVILIQFEFNLFGDAATTATFPLFLLLLRLWGKTPCLMIHQVVEDLCELRAHVGLQNKPFQFALYRRLLPMFYGCLQRIASRVAVHEPVLQKTLADRFKKPITVIPHGCGTFSTRPSYQKARAALQFDEQDTVLLCFGFLAHYKGSDWIVQEVAHYVKQNGDCRLRLVLAGGESPNHAGKPHYQEYVSGLTQLAAQHCKHIEITGFIPEHRVPFYFCAADLALFPYRTCMSASGPLAIALAYGTPFLLSAPLKPVLESGDFVEARKSAGLSVEDLTFDLTHGAVMRKIIGLRKAEARLRTMRMLSSAVGERRSWSVVAGAYQSWLNGNGT